MLLYPLQPVPPRLYVCLFALQVAGTNFLARVHVNGKVYTVKVFRPLPHTGAAPEVSSVTEGDHL
jgi:hypothetical protein